MYMKKWIMMLCVFFSLAGFSQTMPDFELIKMERASDFKAAEPFVIQTAVYLLSTPIGKKGDNRLKSMQFIFKWMSGTPDHAFILNEMGQQVGKESQDIFGVYMAAMSKAALDHKAVPKDMKVVKLTALNMLLDYCENKANQIKVTKQVKKLSEARSRGELETLL